MEPKKTFFCIRLYSVMIHPFIILSQGDWISTRMSQEFSRWSGNGFFHLLLNGIYLGLYTHYKDFRHSRWDDHFQNNVIYDPSPPIEVPGETRTLHLKRVRVVKRHRQVVPSILEKGVFQTDVSDEPGSKVAFHWGWETSHL